MAQSSVTIYPVSNYSFGTKAPKFEKDSSVVQRMERLREKWVLPRAARRPPPAKPAAPPPRPRD